jgi:hypothetical protein
MPKNAESTENGSKTALATRNTPSQLIESAKVAEARNGSYVVRPIPRIQAPRIPLFAMFDVESKICNPGATRKTGKECL